MFDEKKKVALAWKNILTFLSLERAEDFYKKEIDAIDKFITNQIISEIKADVINSYKPQEISIPLTYNFKGSANSTLTMRQRNDMTISLISGYAEKIKDVSSGFQLKNVLEDIIGDKYA